ncbi:MAG: C-GCAxxG-C-C family protein, partial [Bacteroidetes bacterium]|nr:C-GCAxxG-C-C family protein [Bacteroidota bacterium]
MNSTKIKLKTKRVFLKKGTCSRTFFYILNREFGYPMDKEERAIDPMAGGVLQQGYQCGMLWGASMAVGAESLRRINNLDKAIALAIKATQHLMASFVNRAKSIECEDITNCDMTNKSGLVKFFLTGKPISCLNLAGKWAPEAIKAATEGLSQEQTKLTHQPISCASEVVKRMGGGEEEMAMVAGFAGGLGLSGNGCGALAATIWMTILELLRTESWKPALSDPVTEKIL